MPRYFIEVAYKGTHYSGFQIQHNANSIQAEIEKALLVFFNQTISLTGSSRTDAGVHALQNFFHTDTSIIIEERVLYNLNALLPNDIAIKSIRKVDSDTHCRFDAKSREYKYFIYRNKNPFLTETAFYYPYTLNKQLLNEAAAIILKYQDFSSFSKRRTQVKTFDCKIFTSEWIEEDEKLVYHIVANRFLRGMVKGLVGTMLLVGREKISLKDFASIIESKDATKADFSVPSHGLLLVKVAF